MNYRDIIQKIVYYLVDPLIHLMLRLGITPNGITAAGFVGNLVAMACFIRAALLLHSDIDHAYMWITWGGGIILFAGIFDMMDGRMARQGNLSSPFGALWDSTLDRYSEMVTLFGICLIFIKADWFWMGVTTFAAMIGSIMVSYVRARAEGLNIECKVGLMQRPERVVVTSLVAIISGATANLWWMAGGMMVIAILANLTAFWRILHCYRILSIVLFLLTFTPQMQAQPEVRLETQLSTSSGDHTPLWLNANKYGLSSLDTQNGYLRAGISRPTTDDSLKQWRWGYGADVAITQGYTSRWVIQEAYGELQWKQGLLTIGSKEQPIELKNQELSSGAQTLGCNARPLPSVRLSLPHYWTIPKTRGWLHFKGHLAYGIRTDDRWQRQTVDEQSVHTEHAKLHTKAGFLKIGKDHSPVNVELGLEMACQYGGTSHNVFINNQFVTIKNEDGLKGMYHAFIPGGGEVSEGIYANASGNHLGSYLIRVNIDQPTWQAAVYADHYFEDHSQMFLLDFDGYGQGEKFNERQDWRFFGYDLKDIMLGAEFKLKSVAWLNAVVVEYLYTKYQSGPLYHDRTRHLSDHIAGRDNYYNNYVQAGWQHWGQVMGNPLYRSPLYNKEGQLEVTNNRFWAWHVGIAGDPLTGLHYRLLATWQRGWGTYALPFEDPQRNMSLMAEASYQFSQRQGLDGWAVKAAVGMDHGQILGNNTGMQLTISKRFNIKKK